MHTSFIIHLLRGDGRHPEHFGRPESVNQSSGGSPHRVSSPQPGATGRLAQDVNTPQKRPVGGWSSAGSRWHKGGTGKMSSSPEIEGVTEPRIHNTTLFLTPLQCSSLSYLAAHHHPASSGTYTQNPKSNELHFVSDTKM